MNEPLNPKRKTIFDQTKLQEMANELSNSQKPAKEKPLLIKGAFRFNGCGTALIGSRDFHLDGTFITTAWMTFMFVPIFPIQSFRIRSSGDSYTVCEKYWLNLKQVFSTYLFVAFYVGWLTGVYYSCAFFNYAAFSLIIAVFAITVPLFLPTLLRHLAEREVFKGSNR